MLEITIDLQDVYDLDDVQQELLLAWNEKKLNNMLKNELVAKSLVLQQIVDKVELALFGTKATLLILYKNNGLHSQNFLKINWDITSDIVVLSWETRIWTIEVVKI